MLDAVYFDGRSARGHAVRVEIDGDRLCVSGDGIERREPLAALRLSARIGRAPRTIAFADGASCELRDHAALEAMLRRTPLGRGWLHRAEADWKIVALAVVAIALVAAAALIWGVPRGAQWIADTMPERMTRALSEQSLNLLDRHLLHKSTLDPTRAADLTGAAEALRAPDGSQPVCRLEFRSAPDLGPNAFALPDGTVVLLDELVALADDDEQILGVIAHELGHVHNRHGLRLVAQNSAIGVLAAWWFGDVSTVLATAPTVLMQARYSRAFEAEADRYAAALLRANGIAPARLGALLRKLDAQRGHGGDDPFGGLLDSHPALLERARALDDVPADDAGAGRGAEP